MKVETQLAGASMTNVELRDPQKVYHRLDLAGLKKLAPDVAWDSYLAKVGFPGITAINVAQPDFVKELDGMTKSIKMADWRTYLRWHLGRGASPWLSRKFVDEWFLFRQVLTGIKVLQPRWKRCVRFADEMMGEALAQPFVKEHLGEDGKQAAAQMVEGIEASMKNDLASLAWMDDATRTKAEDKLARIDNKIGYPAKWRSYDGLAIERASFLANAERASAFEVKRELGEGGQARRQGRVGDDPADGERLLRAHDERDGLSRRHPPGAVLRQGRRPRRSTSAPSGWSSVTSSRTGSTTRAASSTPRATCATGGRPP